MLKTYQLKDYHFQWMQYGLRVREYTMHVGNGFYTTRMLGDQWIKDLSIPMFSKSAIRGTNYNNIFLGGAFGLLMHFNGTDWKNYQFIEVSYNDFLAVLDVKDNLVCAVGANANNKAIIYLEVLILTKR